MTNNRDEFSKKIKQQLYERASGFCSNPECGVLTKGPSHEGEDKVNNIGVAAHICAAASGQGARRYDSTMSSTDRKSIDNGIWLCGSCSIKIDRDETTYTRQLLLEWKLKHTKRMTEMLGKKPADHNDATNLLVSALGGGHCNATSSFIPNVHNAVKKALEESNPGLRVETGYINNNAVYYITGENLQFHVTGDHQVEKEINRLVEHGETVILKNVEVQPPKLSFLVNTLSGPVKSIKLEPKNNKKAKMKIKLADPSSKNTEVFEEINGQITYGSKSYRFEGAACEGLFSLNFQRSWKEGAEQSKLNITLSMAYWEGRQLTDLPYFKTLLNLYQRLNLGWNCAFAVEINGDILAESPSNSLSGEKFVVETISLLLKQEVAMEICKLLDQQILFSSNFSVSTSHSFEQLCDLKERITSNTLREEERSKALVLFGQHIQL